MMDIGGDNPVTLIVKAPNQRIADQTVDCFLEWTVRKLKEHLENVYPSKPKHNQQKLIYSGKLLQDHVTLKEVLRQLDEASLHTVHLVCANGADGVLIESSSSDGSDSVSASPMSSSSSTDQSDGLRYRGPSMPGMAPGMTPFQFGGNPMSMPPMSMPPAYGYTPEQYMWMQQMYAQYMTQYMQYYNNAYQTPPNTPPVTQTDGRPANQNPANNVPVAPAANPNMRMNAQGGMEEDDEEEFEHRDWLDYIYILFRFLVLLSVVYFYSTLSRFIAVFTGFFLIYLLQKGWLNLRRNAPAQRQQPAAEEEPAQQPEQQQQPAQEQQHNTDDDAQQDTDANTNTEASENPDAATPETPQSPVVEQRPSVLAMVWCFLSTFITSLVPQQPPAVNAN